ncbi:hypothetical protein GCG54_00002103 [Colletotrichum gloeosporioides]|uniref:Uncharacterized protein n=1 Tax=Colletotrichum gloeosporioides TaxID=474922 RepID=A0A8H4C8X1_COLGL|nr:uncharacterized protein GCG54_00002103 [Colletotrichum gloeosporioides]KAF3799402.1 hypothetical protein GCG54_00002103 [Colletotrichum gloeosporioides]
MSNFVPSASVREKLLLGIKIGSQRRAKFEALHRKDKNYYKNESPNDVIAIDNIRSTDWTLEIPYDLHQEAIVASATQQVVSMGLENQPTVYGDRGELGLDKREMRAEWLRHHQARLPFVQGSVRRLKAALGAFNENPYNVQGMTSLRRAGQVMNVEWRQSPRDRQMSMNFSAFQERSKETSGYRRRTIHSIHFQKEDNARYKDFGPPLDAENAQKYRESLSTEITDAVGKNRRWLCIEISRPLVLSDGPVPLDLDPMPLSTIKIAVPIDKVTVMPHPWQHQMVRDIAPDQAAVIRLGDFSNSSHGSYNVPGESARLRLKLSKDGIPIFMTQSKSDQIPGHRIVEDFLTTDKVPGLPWKETDRRAKAETKVKRKEEFWERVGQAAQENRLQWISLQQSMARDSCVVDIVFKDEWIDVPARIAARDLSRDPSFAQVPAQISRHIRARPSVQPTGGYSSHASYRPGSSGLRNEVRM